MNKQIMLRRGLGGTEIALPNGTSWVIGMVLGYGQTFCRDSL